MRSNFLARITIIALLGVMCAVAVSAQQAQGSGTVTLKQADGTTVPVKDAVVVFYRTDIKGEFRTKTDKNGKYVYAGLPYAGIYTIAVSAPNAQPNFIANIPVGRKPENDFTLEPGDGSVLTLDKIKAVATSTGGGAAVSAAEARRNKEEYDKKVAENENAKATNAKLGDILKAGNTAFDQKRYDEAIASYEQGIQADPTQAVFYNNKSLALRALAIDKFNTAIRAKDTAGTTTARANFKSATQLADKAVSLNHEVKSKNATGGAQAQNEELNLYLTPRVETYRIALQAATPDIAEGAVKAIEEYLAVEPDAAKKSKVQISLGDALMQSNRVDESIAVYKKVLATSPDNLDAMYGLGVALAASAGDPPNPGKAGEARDMLQRFANKAPANDPRKQEAAAIAQSFDEQLKSKPASTGKGRRKG